MQYLRLVVLSALCWLGGMDAEAAAPDRTAAWCTSMGISCPGGLPYAEAAVCAQSFVIACEDFNGGPTFFPTGRTTCWQGNCSAAWFNPAQTGIGTLTGGVQTYGPGNRYINLVSTYPALTSTSLPTNGTDYVWVSNYDTTLGVTDGNYGASWLYLRDVVNSGGGGSGAVIATYANGMAATNEFHLRFQIYWTDPLAGDHQQWVWPGFPKPDAYSHAPGAANCAGLKVLFHYTPGGRFIPASANTDGGVATDCAWYNGSGGAGTGGQRFGNGIHVATCGGPCNYEKFPMCFQCDQSPTHMEYAPYLSDSVSYRPNDTPTVGRPWRANTGRKYTIEYHAKWGTPGTRNGVVEIWIDGTKIYSASDIYNCAGSANPNDNCGPGGQGLGALFLSSYVLTSDGTAYAGQQVVDNLVVAAGDNYIGVPGGSGSGDTTPPAAPTGVFISLLGLFLVGLAYWGRR